MELAKLVEALPIEHQQWLYAYVEICQQITEQERDIQGLLAQKKAMESRLYACLAHSTLPPEQKKAMLQQLEDIFSDAAPQQ